MGAYTVAVVALILLIYTYIGHPIVLMLMSRFSPKPWNQVEALPKVLIFVSAYNEEASISKKISNLLQLSYVGELKIVIANDASTDSTAEIVQNHAKDRITLRDFRKNIGKTAMQNECIQESDADIVIFSDATSIWPSDTVSMIVRNFADADVGCVAVDVDFVRSANGGVEKGQGAFWRYERFLRLKGALAGTGVVASGTCYALRRELFSCLSPEIAEDLGRPLNIAKSGYRVVFDGDVRVSEFSNVSHDEESAMRARVALQNITALFSYAEVLKPKYGFVAFQFFSLKLLRAVSWIALVLLYVGSFIGRENSFMALLFGAQTIFYASAVIGLYRARSGRSAGMLDFPYYFTLLNFSYAIALGRYFRGAQGATWETNR